MVQLSRLTVVLLRRIGITQALFQIAQAHQRASYSRVIPRVAIFLDCFPVMLAGSFGFADLRIEIPQNRQRRGQRGVELRFPIDLAGIQVIHARLCEPAQQAFQTSEADDCAGDAGVMLFGAAKRNSLEIVRLGIRSSARTLFDRSQNLQRCGCFQLIRSGDMALDLSQTHFLGLRQCHHAAIYLNCGQASIRLE